MPKEFEVEGTVYEFPDEYTDQQVQGILTKQGIIKAAGNAERRQRETLGGPPPHEATAMERMGGAATTALMEGPLKQGWDAISGLPGRLAQASADYPYLPPGLVLGAESLKNLFTPEGAGSAIANAPYSLLGLRGGLPSSVSMPTLEDLPVVGGAIKRGKAIAAHPEIQNALIEAIPGAGRGLAKARRLYQKTKESGAAPPPLPEPMPPPPPTGLTMQVPGTRVDIPPFAGTPQTQTPLGLLGPKPPIPMMDAPPIWEGMPPTGSPIKGYGATAPPVPLRNTPIPEALRPASVPAAPAQTPAKAFQVDLSHIENALPPEYLESLKGHPAPGPAVARDVALQGFLKSKGWTAADLDIPINEQTVPKLNQMLREAGAATGKEYTPFKLSKLASGQESLRRLRILLNAK